MTPPTRPGFFAWLHTVYSNGGAHGSVLVEHNNHHAAGRFYTGPADADDDLKRAEELGWIVRGKWTPTLSQRAALGLGHKNPSEETRWFYSSHWYWMVPAFGTPGHAAGKAALAARGTVVP